MNQLPGESLHAGGLVVQGVYFDSNVVRGARGHADVLLLERGGEYAELSQVPVAAKCGGDGIIVTEITDVIDLLNTLRKGGLDKLQSTWTKSMLEYKSGSVSE